MLKTRDLTKRFGGLAAINGIDIRITKASITGIIGPNGSGKTTLFNVISGYLKASRGDVSFEEKNLHGLRPHEIVNRGIVRTFQVPQCCRNLTVRENIRLACLRHYPQDQLETKALLFAGLAKLEPYYDVVAENIPIGCLRKIEMAMAIATDPKLILLDEPFSGLTDLECEDLSTLIRDLYKRVTLVIIDHKLKHLMPLVERVLVLNQGTVFFDGSPDEVVANQDVRKIYLGGDIQYA